MYLGYQNGKVKFYSETPLNKELYNIDKIEETQEKYVLSDGEYVLYDAGFKEKELKKAKEAKKLEASKKAYEYIENGALYEFAEGKHIEANDGNISKLGLALMELLLNQDTESTIEWCSAEDETVKLNAGSLSKIVQGLKAEQTRVWTVLFPEFLKQIEQAQTLEEIKSIEIDYKIKEAAGGAPDTDREPVIDDFPDALDVNAPDIIEIDDEIRSKKL